MAFILFLRKECIVGIVLFFIVATALILFVLAIISFKYFVVPKIERMIHYILHTKPLWKVLHRFVETTKFSLCSVVICTFVIVYTNKLGSKFLYLHHIFPATTCVLAYAYIINERRENPSWNPLRILIFCCIGFVVVSTLHFVLSFNLTAVLLLATTIKAVSYTKNLKQEVMELIAFVIFSLIFSYICYQLDFYTQGIFNHDQGSVNAKQYVYMYIHPIILYSLFVVFIIEKFYFPLNDILAKTLSRTFIFLSICFLTSILFLHLNLLSAVIVTFTFFGYDLFRHDQQNLYRDSNSSSDIDSSSEKKLQAISQRKKQIQVTSTFQRQKNYDFIAPKVRILKNRKLDAQIHKAKKMLGKEGTVVWKFILEILHPSIEVYQKQQDGSYVRYVVEVLGQAKSSQIMSTKLQECQANIANTFIKNRNIFHEALQLQQLHILYRFLHHHQPQEKKWEKYLKLIQNTMGEFNIETQGWKRCANVKIISQNQVVNRIADYPPMSLPRPVPLRFPIFNQNHINLLSSQMSHCDYWIKTKSHFLYYCENEKAEITLVDNALIKENDHNYRYQAVWGSSKITYELTLELPISAKVYNSTLKLISGVKPKMEITGRYIKVSSVQAWFAKITVDYNFNG